MPGGVKPPRWFQFNRAWAKSADPFGPQSAERQPRKLLGHTFVARVEEVPQRFCETKKIWWPHKGVMPIRYDSALFKCQAPLLRPTRGFHSAHSPQRSPIRGSASLLRPFVPHAGDFGSALAVFIERSIAHLPPCWHISSFAFCVHFAPHKVLQPLSRARCSSRVRSYICLPLGLSPVPFCANFARHRGLQQPSRPQCSRSIRSYVCLPVGFLLSPFAPKLEPEPADTTTGRVR